MKTLTLRRAASARPAVRCHAGPSSGQAFRLSTVSVREQPQPSSFTPTVGVGIAGVGLVVAYLFQKWRRSNEVVLPSSDRQAMPRQDLFAKVIMKDVNTSDVPRLTEEQIAAARARRIKDMGDLSCKLDDIELPDNHPWATRENGKGKGRAASAISSDRDRVRAPLPKRRQPPPPPARHPEPSEAMDMRTRPQGVRSRLARGDTGDSRQ